MTIFRMLGLALLVNSVLAAVPATAAVKVFLLGGQSNMAGTGAYPGGSYGLADLPCPAPYNVPQTAVQFWNYGPAPQPDPRWNINYPDVGTGWVDLQPGYGHTPAEFGPEVTFGYRLHELYPNDEIYLVKEGITSQSLAVNWNPNGGEIFDIFQSRVTAAMANLTAAGKSPTIAGMIWMQGEADAMRHDWATAYAANLANLVTTVRSPTLFGAFAEPTMPFVAGRITNYYEWGTPADNTLVRNTQMNIGTAVGNASWVDTDDLPWAYVGHYGTQGQITLGARFADELAAISQPAEPVPVHWTGTGGTTWSTAVGLNNWHDSGDTPANYINGAPVTFNDMATGTTVDISTLDVLPTSVIFNNSSKNFTISGTKGIAGATDVVKLGEGMVTLNSANTYTGVTTVEAGTLRLGAAAQSPLLTGAGGADLQGGKIWFDYTTSSPATTISGLLAASYHDGAWDAGQFTNTTAGTTGLSLGWADNTTGKKVIVMTTRAGDADLSGTVDVSDLTSLLNNYNKGGMVWSSGDFNYDGVVNVADLTGLLNNYNKTVGSMVVTGQSAGGSATPEPGTFVLLVTGLLGLLACTWRRFASELWT